MLLVSRDRADRTLPVAAQPGSSSKPVITLAMIATAKSSRDRRKSGETRRDLLDRFRVREGVSMHVFMRLEKRLRRPGIQSRQQARYRSS